MTVPGRNTSAAPISLSVEPPGATLQELLTEVRRWGTRLDTADGSLVLDRFEDAAADGDAAVDAALGAGRIPPAGADGQSLPEDR